VPGDPHPQLGHRIRERRKGLELTQERPPSMREMCWCVTPSSWASCTDHLLTGEATVPIEIAGAIRSDDRLSAAAKRHLLGIIAELAA